jgi:exodeoxyribonuclease X
MRLTAIDLETTGFTPPDHAPCEVGWTDLVARSTDLAGAPSSWDIITGTGVYCHPGRPIPPETSAVHHIIDDDVCNAAPWSAALRAVAAPDSALAPDVFVAHSAKFERQWITDELTGGKPWICSYKCALRLWPDAPSHSNQALRYWRKPAGLDRQVAFLAHRAFPDAYVTAFLLRDMLQEATVEQLIQWSNEPALLVRVPFGQSRGQRWTEVDFGFLNWVLARDFDEDVMHTAAHERERRRRAFAEEQASA